MSGTIKTIPPKQVDNYDTRWLGKKFFFSPVTMKNPEIKFPYSFDNIFFKTSDNVKLHGWYIGAKEDKPTIIYCHGREGNIKPFLEKQACELNKKGYGVLVFHCRGYGKSQGSPSEKGLYNDLQAAVDYINKEKNIKNKDIILWGHSLGGAIVANIASKTEEPFKKVIIQSTFTNAKDAIVSIISRYSVGYYLGLGRLFGYIGDWCNLKFNTDNKIEKIKSPLTIIHSTKDTLLPVSMAKKLHNKKQDAQLLIDDFGDHRDEKGLAADKIIDIIG